MEKDKPKLIRVSASVHAKFARLVEREKAKRGYPVKASPMVDDLINFWEAGK